jgi:hypothetical protein
LSDFVDQEFASLNLGDKRRNDRLRRVLSSFLDSPKASIQAAVSGWAEAMGAYRLLNNEATTLDAVLAPHREATVERVRAYRSVALIQDTTELDFTRKTQLEGRGPFGAADNPRRGLFLHTQLAVTEDRLPLGVYDIHLYARAERSAGEKKINNHCLPIEEKESYRWLKGYRKACELATAAGKDVEVFSISDREGDIYEIFEQRELYLRERERRSIDPAHWIVRTVKDRILIPLDEEEGGNPKEVPTTLFAQAAEGSVLGEVVFSVKKAVQVRDVTQARKERITERSQREVRLQVRVVEVTPRVPRRIGGKKLASVSYWVIDGKETDPPKGEEPIHWVISTSYEVKTFDDAQRILRFYVARWDIEVFHRVLKTGCRVEEIQLKSESALRPCLALNLIVAWRILYLTHLGRECPDLPCSVVFEQAEWKSVVAIAVKRKMKGSEQVRGREPTLAQMIGLVASFGGHLGRKADGPPGPQSMWQGMLRMRDFSIAWEVFGG